jgi:hypothetical protein
MSISRLTERYDPDNISQPPSDGLDPLGPSTTSSQRFEPEDGSGEANDYKPFKRICIVTLVIVKSAPDVIVKPVPDVIGKPVPNVIVKPVPKVVVYSYTYSIERYLSEPGPWSPLELRRSALALQ